jgi:hypothetical protein
MTDSVTQAVLSTVLNDRADYTKVRSPALAIYAETFFDVRNGDTAQLAKNLDWEQKYMTPFRAASIERVRRELPSVEIVKIPGTHKDFVFTSREQVASAMQRFLGGTEKGLGGPGLLENLRPAVLTTYFGTIPLSDVSRPLVRFKF